MTLPDDLYHIAEHIGDDQPNLPEGAKNTLLKAAELISKLPHTADGVPVTDPTPLYWWDGEAVMQGAGAMDELCIFRDPNRDGVEISPREGISACYSTREAAEKASKP